MPRQVLFIRNDPTAPEAMLGETFSEMGFDVDTFDVIPKHLVDNPVLDVNFPDPARYDIIVPLGARWAVYDERLRQSWVASEIQLVQEAIASGVGVLGICFGGQLVATAMGGTVCRSDTPEIGWCEVRSNMPDLLPHGPWFQWHFDHWTLPPGATEIARNNCASQAFIQDTAMAVQFHPELDRSVLEVWISEDQGDAAELGHTFDGLRARTELEFDDAARRLRRLVRGFVDIVVSGESRAQH